MPSPEAGEWTIESYGADVAEGGEPVTYSSLDETPINESPTASFTTTRTGETFTFDATGARDVDGSITAYRWEFADGATATGPVATHTFAPGTYDVTLVTTDNQGAQGFGHSSTVLRVGSDAAAATIYSGTALTLTNAVTADGGDANLYVDGAFSCNSNGHVAGDVTVVGDAYLTSSCRIDGDLWVSGALKMDSSPRVGGDVRAGGAITFQSTARIGGSVTTGSTFTSTDGRSVAQLRASGALAGVVNVSSFVLLPETSAGNRIGTAPLDGTAQIPWAAWLRAIATGANAPSWSPSLSDKPGCTVSTATAGTSTVPVTSAAWIDARKVTTRCDSVALQGLTLRLSADLTIVSDGIASTNGMRVVSADGKPHTLRLVVPGTVGPAAGVGQITLLGTTDVDPLITAVIATPGTVQINGPAQFNGQLIAGRLVLTGGVTVHSKFEPAQL